MWLENILWQEIVQRLGWTLLHFVWQATAVALLLAIVLAVLQRSTANLRYTVACLALGLMVALPVMTVPLIGVSRPLPNVNVEPPAAPVSVPVRPTTDVTPSARVVEYEEPIQPETIEAAPTIPWKQRAAAMLEPALPYLVCGWLLGVLGLSVWHLGGWAQLQRLRRKLTRPVDASLHAVLKHLTDKLGVGRAVELLESALVQVPTVVGWLRPVILLPASALTGLSAEQLEAILAHELAHIRRCDYLVNMLQTVVETLGFYHPAVWWVSHKIRIERENCCDDMAVGVTGDRVSYARALTSMEEIRAGRSELAVAASGGNLFARIHRLVGKDSPDSARAGWIPFVITILLIAIIALPAALALTAKSEPQQTQEAVKPQDQAAADKKQTIISGRCLDSGRQPLADAQVLVFCRASGQNSVKPVTQSKTDSEGRFRLGPIHSPSEEDWGHKSYFVFVPADGHGPAWKEVNLYEEPIKPLELTAYKSAVVTGSVVAENSKPVAGAQVCVRGIVSGETAEEPPSPVSRFSTHVPLPGWSTTTDSDGAFQIAGLPDGARIQLFVSGRDLAASIVHVMAGSHAKIKVQPGATIAGRVLYGKTEKPAAGVVVGVQGVEHISIPGGWMATGGPAVTDEQGRYRLESLSANKYNVYAEAENLTVVALDSFEAKTGEVREAPDLVLIEGGFIAGRVIDEATGKPVKPGQHSSVAIYGPSHPKSGAAVGSSRIRDDGSFRIRVAPGSNYTYLMPQEDWSKGYINLRSPWVDVAEGQIVEVELRAKKLSAEELEKQAAFWHELNSHVPQTLDELEYSANRLKQLGLAIAMYANEHDDTLPAGLQQLEGYVPDQELWRWLLDNVEYLGKGKTGQPNAARIPIAYDRTLLQRDYSNYSTEVLFLDSSVRFVGAPELGDLGIKQIRRPTQTKPATAITGRVLYGATGKPAGGVVVYAMEAEPGSTQDEVLSPWRQTVTDEQGRYRLESLRSGEYGVWVEAENLTAVAIDSFQVKAGQTSEAPDMVLIEGGFINGRVIDEATGKPIKLEQYSGVIVSGPFRPKNGLREAFPVREDGSFRIRVAPGRNSVALQPIQHRSGAKEYASLRSVSVTVDEGETVEVELRVRKLSMEETSAERLTSIGRAMLAYANDHDGKYPARSKLYELQEYLKTEEFAWPSQYEYLADGRTTADPPDIVIYHDADLMKFGKGTNVLFNDGHVEFVGPKRLDELNINKTQILIETHILVATDDFLKENRLDANSVRTGEIRPVYSMAESAAEPNSLPYCLILDVPDVDQRFKARYTPEGQQTRILKAPQALTLDGRPVTIGMHRKFAASIPSDANNLSGKAESKPQYVDVGTVIKIVADALPNSNNVLLDFEWEDSQFRGFEERAGPDGKKQMVPIIARDNIKATATVPDGKTLLIGGKKIPRWDVTQTKEPLLGDLPLIGSLFRSESKVEETRNVLILIKPTIASQEQIQSLSPTGSGQQNNVVITDGNSSAAVPSTPSADAAIYEQLETAVVDLSALRPTMSFGEALDVISRSVDPPLDIRVIWKDLQARAHINGDTKIGMEGASEVLLGTGLENMLEAVAGESADLNYVVDNGTIRIATLATLPAKMLPRVYDISDLVTSAVETDALTRRLMETIEPESWHDLNEAGNGTVLVYPLQEPKKLAILQSRKTHGKIKDMLDKLRTSRCDQTKTGPAILIETRLLTVSDEFLKYIDLDPNSPANSKVWSEYLVHSTSDSASFVVDQLHIDLLLRNIAARMRTHKDIQMLHMPRSIAMDGKKEQMRLLDSRSVLFSSPDEPNQPSGETESTSNRMELGTTIWLTPNLMPDGKTVNLDFEWEYRRLRGFKEYPGPDKQSQKVPQIAVDSIKTSCPVPDGKTLLIAGKRIIEDEKKETEKPMSGNLPLIGRLFSSPAKTGETRNLLILIRTTADPKKQAEIQAASKPKPLPPLEPNDPLIRKLERKLESTAKQR